MQNRTVIEWLIAWAAVMLVASIARSEPAFTVTNHMPAFQVRNLMPPKLAKCSLCDDCRCKACDCNALEKRLANPPFVPKTKVTAFSSTATVKQSLPVQTIVSHQSSASHTHACPNINCSFRKTYGEPYVWNHAMDGGTHVCAYCKTMQKYVSGRPITILRTVAVSDAALSPPRATYATVPTSTVYSLPQASAACANGNCAAANVSRGFIRR